MQKRRTLLWVIGMLQAASVVMPTPAWCQQAQDAAAEALLPAVPQMPKLTAEQRKKQEALLAKLDKDMFPWPLIEDKANAPLWLDLAGGARPGPVVEAALHAAENAFAPGDDSKHAAVHADYRRVVLARLTVGHAKVQLRAFMSLGPLLQGKLADAPTLVHLRGLLKPGTDVAVRHAIAQSLGLVGLYALRDSPELPSLVLATLADSDSGVRAIALAHMATYGRSQSFVRRAGPKLPALVQASVTSGPLPERVLAASALAVLGPYLSAAEAQSKALELLVALLRAEEPALRAVGAMALVSAPKPEALPRLIELLDDNGSSLVTLSGPKMLNGNEQKLPVSAVGQAPMTVAHAAVQAVMIASNPASDNGFFCRPPESATADADLAACIVKARAWYATRK